MQILSIGNSFSQDAQSRLHAIAHADGARLDSYNLYIGGCSLERHYRNMLGDFREYTLEMNGTSTGFSVSMKEALLNRDWDVVTLQQVSSLSDRYDTYQPYLDALCDCVRKCLPHTKIVLHQVWAYEQGSERLEHMGYSNQADMFRAQTDAFERACNAVHPDGSIRSGELFQRLWQAGVTKLHRDTCHASLGVGRYALGLLWYAALSGKNIDDNSFSAFEEPIPFEQIKLVKQCVTDLIGHQS